jgi:hypothetical protein
MQVPSDGFGRRGSWGGLCRASTGALRFSRRSIAEGDMLLGDSPLSTILRTAVYTAVFAGTGLLFTTLPAIALRSRVQCNQEHRACVDRCKKVFVHEDRIRACYDRCGVGWDDCVARPSKQNIPGRPKAPPTKGEPKVTPGGAECPALTLTTRQSPTIGASDFESPAPLSCPTEIRGSWAPIILPQFTAKKL